MENITVGEGFKACSKCGAEKPLSDFYLDKRRKTGYSSWCRQCTQADHKNWKVNHPEEVKASKRKWRSGFDPNKRRDQFYRYGVDREWFDKKLEDQGGGCGICGTTVSGKNSFHIDHNHKTRRLRGVLCWRCNIFLAHLEHDPRRAELSFSYLRKYGHNH